MKASWFTGLDDQKVKDLKVSLASSQLARRRLATLLDGKLEDSQKVGRSKLLYDSPNWSYLQADARGYERALAEIKDLVSF